MKEHLLARAGGAEESEYETVSMTIDEAGMEILMHNLTNLYSHPQHAVLREYSSNALDSHQRAGQSKAIQIHLPNYNERYLSIEDFGVGLSKVELRDVYSRYGASTKRDSNTQIGAFGLGAKSALALSERFDIVATKDGVTTVAYVQKNARKVGQFYFVSEERTGAPSGVKITVPLAEQHLRFYASDQLRGFFLGWPAESLEFLGANQLAGKISVHDSKRFSPLKLAGTTVGWVATGTGTEMGHGGNTQLHLNVGGVYYAASASKIEGNLAEEHAAKLRALRNYNRLLVLNVPLGGVEMTPSREDLIYSQLTLDTLSTLAENALSVLVSTVQRELNALPTRKAALYRVLAEKADALPLAATLTYRGEKVPVVTDVDGWFKIVPKDRGKPAHVKTYGPGDVLELSRVAREEVTVYNDKGKSQSSTQVHDFEQRKAIRITDANVTEVQYAKSYLLKTFEQLRFPGRKVDATVWFTARGVQLDEWTAPLITETLTYRQFKAEVQAEKKRQRAEMRKASSGAPAIKAADRVTFGVIGALRTKGTGKYQVDYYDMELMTPAQINALGRQVVLSHKQLPSPFNLAAFSASYTRTVGDHNSTLRFVKHYHPDVLVVGVPRNVSLTTLEKRFPNHVLLSNVLRADIARVTQGKTATDVLQVAAQRVRTHSGRASTLAAYAAKMTPAQFSAVRSPNTRAYLRDLLLKVTKSEAEPSMDEQLYEAFGRSTSTFDAEINTQVSRWQERALRYRLLYENLYYGRDHAEDIEHAILYINAVDASLEAGAL